MKTTRYFFLMLLMTLFGMSAEAQQRNVLRVSDVTTQIGNIQLPVSIENTDEIVGLQFDLTLPDGITAEATGVLTNRGDGHTVTMNKLNSGAYRVLLHSAQNHPLLGQSGIVMYLPISIPDSYEEGSEHFMTIANAVLGKATGETVLTEATAGKIYISKLPDLVVTNISCDKQTASPGENIICSWQVENTGELTTGSGWSEQVSLVSEDGTQSKLIATTHYNDLLEAGGVLSRQVEITLPTLLGIDGQTKVQVCIVPNTDTGESPAAQGNNTQMGSSIVNINKFLLLELSPNRINEDSGQRVALRVNRSGGWTVSETFTATATTDSRVNVPSSITVPANQSGAIVYLSVADNAVLDNDSIINISVEGNGYSAVSGQLVIEDNEYPDLTLTASKSDLTEGETFQLTVTTSRVSTKPIEVSLSSENTKRFSFPRTLTIPAGETSLTVDVVAVDDELPSRELSNAFTVSSPRYNKAEVIVLLKDNDLPVLELKLTPSTVQESAGVVAVAGILRRTTSTNNKITVKLTDNSGGGLYFGNRTLVLEKGVEEVHFNFGPVDNATVDGDRIYTITAAVWISSCNCDASGESMGFVTADLAVLDNDGPALQLTSSHSTLKEGSKAMLAVSRNTADTSKALSVALSSDYDEGLTYNHIVTIPAGQQSVMVEVASAANSTQGDSHTVVFTAETNGYSTGTCYITVTDQTLPDARISSFTADVTNAEVGTKAKLNIVVTNDGAADLPAEVPVNIYRRGSGAPIGTVYTSEALVVGSSETVTKIITLPTSVGIYNYFAVVNEAATVSELTYNNNTSQDIVITTEAPFSVTVSTDKSIYQQGENVLISGHLTGNGTANAEVDLYLINEGIRQVQTLKTDANGAFTYNLEPYAQQSGHFAVGACYPGEGLRTEMATFDIYGLRRTNSDFITCETYLGETYEGTVYINNPGVLPQTVASFEVVSKPKNCDVVLEAPSNIVANGYAQLKYKITGNATTETKDWEQIIAKLTTKEGTSLTFTIYYYCASHHAVLTTNTNSIKTTMTKGATREYLINVMNTGKGATGKINVQLPNVEWMRLGTLAEMPSLEYGETATICLRLTPTDDMPLNLPYTGQLALTCENGNGTTVSYNIEAVSEATGTFIVDVVDEYSFETEEKPHVAEAGVMIMHPVTGAVVAQGLTGIDGTYSVELPEGYYSITVTKDHHKSMSGNILIDPGKTNYQEVFISYDAITYSWDVVETEVEDVYSIKTIAKYETNVPKPVVVVSLPAERPADGSIVAIHVTNKGLINAQNVVMNLNCTEGYDFELLNSDPVEILAPQQMYTFYARFKKHTEDPVRLTAWGNPDADCISILAGALYDYMCGNAKNMEEALAQNSWGDCLGEGSVGELETKDIPLRYRKPPIGPNKPVGPTPRRYIVCPGCVTPGPTSSGPGLLEKLRQWYCSLPCGKELTQALACEAADRIIPDWISCPYNLINNTLFGSVEQAIAAAADCAGIPDPPGEGCWDPYLKCMLKHFLNGSRSIVRWSSSQNRASSYNRGYETAYNFYVASQVVKDEGLAFRRIVEEYFGDSQWLDSDHHELASILYFMDTKADEYLYTYDDFRSLKPQNISEKQLQAFVERLNNTHKYKETNYVGIVNYINPDTINHYTEIIEQCGKTVEDGGWSSLEEMYTTAYTELKDYLADGNTSVCASVTIKLSQTMVMTRQAFRGTLTVFNGNDEIAMQDVKLNLEVVNKTTGEVATNHEFQINAESLEGFTGELDLYNGWTLGAQQTGTATVLFIPTKYAAPEEPMEWSFGGTLSYIDPFTGLEVTRDLYPAILKVKPSPELDLTYFMQRDIYGDDALTPDVVESMKPAEFALLINNKGYGDATNVRMLTQQPEIVDNAKGLYIDFEITHSQVNGGDVTLSFGQSIDNDFGTVPAHSQMYSQWWLTSTLLGHFIDYKVEASHVTSYGNEDLSLLDQVTIHELIHGFDMPDGSLVGGPEIGRAFLVNDIADANDQPDRLYFTNGDTASVVVAATAQIVKKSATEYELTVTPSATGWNYGNVLDPTHSYAELKRIVRKSDGADLGNTRFWQTDRTLRDGKDWLYEHRLHFVDDFKNNDPETYILTFDAVPDKVLEVTSIGVIPAEGEIAEEPIEALTVTFNKEVDASTFGGDDITFSVQGVKKNANQIVITTEDNRQFKLDMSAMNDTLSNGYYTMSVQTANITDAEGYKGKSGKQVGWILFRGGSIVLNTSVWPENAGKINLNQTTVEEITAQYGSTVILTAIPNKGHQFLNWTLNGEVVSTEPAYTLMALDDANVVANFSRMPIRIEVRESDGGHIDGFGTGIYEHHTDMLLTAVPDEDYVLKGWYVNDKAVSETGNTLSLRADSTMTVKAVFEREFYNQTMTLVRGWNWVSSYISEAWPVENVGESSNRIVGQFDELITDPQYGLVGGLEQLMAGAAYKVEAKERFTTSFRGHLLTSPINLKKGWNWVAYPWTVSEQVDNVITNAEEGDYLVGQTGFTEYADGYWEGTLRSLIPGNGYLYKSASDKSLDFDFSSTAGNNARRVFAAPSTDERVDIHRYPNIMSLTATLCKDGEEITKGSYLVYAMANDELRGVSQYVGNNYYLTVYGDEPDNITFICESRETGNTYISNESIRFRDDVVGSRKSPFVITFGEATGIDQIGYEQEPEPITIYSINGIFIGRNMTVEMLKKLPKGVYIVNGKKCYVK